MSQNFTPDHDDARPDRSADSAASDSPTTPLPPRDAVTEQYPAHTEAAEPARKPVMRRGATWAIIGGGVAAALLLVGGGAALGAAIADDDDDRPGIVGESPDRPDDDRPERSDGQGGPGAQGGPGSGPERDGPGQPGAGGPAGIEGASDADELTGIIAKARGADGVSGDATEIEARPGGAWEVRFETTAGAETDVLVASDGTATVRRTDTDDEDDVPTSTLTDAAVASIVESALAEASGTVVKIEAEDDSAEPYEVTVLLTDGGRMDIDLGPDFSVVGTETRG